MGTGLACCVAAGAYGLYSPALWSLRTAPAASLNAPAERPVPPSAKPLPLLQQNAVAFLKDSLPLAGRCEQGCSPRLAEIEVARLAGGFGKGGAATARPLQSSFAPPMAAEPSGQPPAAAALVSAEPESAPQAVAEPVVPAPIRIAPSVVVPLPTAAEMAPIPAPPLDRSGNGSAPPLTASEAVDVPRVEPRTTPLSPAVPVGRNDGVAVYDISAATVYMPDGTRLEAHSGLGYMTDNPRYVDRRNTGPTPPGTYDLKARESRFFGVEALRMIPTEDVKTFGRDGFLTHTYLLRGRPGQSNGCVVFPEYARFLAAYKHGRVKRLVVVPSLKQARVEVASASTR
jgi:hypothetical protein